MQRWEVATGACLWIFHGHRGRPAEKVPVAKQLQAKGKISKEEVEEIGREVPKLTQRR